ncbi:MAG: Na+/H+ antiporter NhaC [Bacteroidales bacterium]|nr:Na+/H+ antiporter NhaC [Bacteroidales bacterium]MBN2818479.1 Na+/H+ antiporter NhaC [Bacteroidales bacterium]
MSSEKKKLSLFVALIPIIFLVSFIAANVLIFDDTLAGSNQIILIFAAAIASIIAKSHKIQWETIKDAIVSNISKAMPAMLILLLIGSLAGTWLISGVVPAMIFYGLKIISPKVFLLTAVVTCALVSLATGSSWSTIATIGVALLGIGKALGFHEGLVAGAVISGAYFGDKMSPLSDTTNLAPAVAGTDLFTHIRYMVITTTPSIILTLIIFTVIGFVYKFDGLQTNIEDVLASIEEGFYISPLLLLVPVFLILIIIRKVPPIPALLAGTLLGGVFAIIFQPAIIDRIAGLEPEKYNYAVASYKSLMTSMFGDIDISSRNEIVNELFSTSGMSGMLNTVWLILSAMVFGGAMDAAGMLRRITEAIISVAKSTGSLIASTIGTSVLFNLTASDQYLAIVIPGKMFAESYKERGLKPEVLSRTLEDGGTITSVLIPWNTCGATQSKVLGVSTWAYLPYCFFNIINPFVAITIGYLGYKIRKTDKKQAEL